MSTDATQIHCPTCHAVHAPNDTGNYECEFCLTPFSYQQAASESERLKEEIQGWLQDKIGAAAVGGSTIDEASRAYIFKDKVLPDLRREVDRSLELLGTFGQFPLVPPPIPVEVGASQGANPLVTMRSAILDLKGLRARLSDPQVSAFAVGEQDKTAIQQMDRRIADFMYLSNVAESAAQRSSTGYNSARRNLEGVITELDQSIALEGASDPAVAGFLASVKNRYQGLTEYCRVCEELCSPNAISGVMLAERLQKLGERLNTVARAVEAMDYNPADTMPLVVGIDAEVGAIRQLTRWTHAYDTLASKVQLPFLNFVLEMDPFVAAGGNTPAAQADMLEGYCTVVRATRGEITVHAISDFSWVDSWIEAGRAKKWLGLFGNEEQAATTTKFLVPVWIGDVSFTESTGTVFKEGVENRGMALVDACSPSAGNVRLLTNMDDPVAQAMNLDQPLPSTNIALPMSTAAAVEPMMNQALRSKPDLKNARVTLRGLAYLPAVVVGYESKKGDREAAACMGTLLKVDTSAKYHMQAAQQLVQRFG